MDIMLTQQKVGMTIVIGNVTFFFTITKKK